MQKEEDGDTTRFTSNVFGDDEIMKQQEVDEDREQEQVNRASKCLHSILSRQGRFDGRNVTKYLKEYRTEATIHKLSDDVAVKEFPVLVEPELKGIVDNVVSIRPTWAYFESRMKEEFQSEDADRVTQAMFLDWINERNKKLEPQELLREFNRRFNQLTAKESEVIKLQKSTLLLRAADEHLQDELDNALDLLNPKRSEESVAWEEMEKAIMKVSQRKRRRILDKEAIHVAVDKSKIEEKKKEVTKESQVDELSKLMEGLKILSAQILGKKNEAQGESSNRGNKWGCMWCDSKDHVRRDCKEFSDALKRQDVKFVGEPGAKKIAYFDSGEPVPLNGNNGGMKALVEKRLEDQKVSMVTATYEPNVYAALREVDVSQNLSTVEKKRLAEHMRKESGWDVPVHITAITAEVGATWEVLVDEKRKAMGEIQEADRQKQQKPNEPVKKREVRFKAKGTTVPMEESSQSEVQEATNKKKQVNKGPGWILGRDIEQTIDSEELANRFWKQEVRGFTNEEFFGCMKKDVQELILAKAKKKRFYKEGPHTLAGSIEEESDDEGGEVYSTQAKSEEEWVQVYDSTFEEMDDSMGTWRQKKKEGATKAYWARGCSECIVEMEGVEGTIRALVDSGSEVNLMSFKLYKEGKWKVDRDIRWGVKAVNATSSGLWGACPGVKVKIGNVIEPMNMFVQVDLPYDLLLGQPFITEMRMETKVLDDGTHIGKVKSRDGLRIIQFPMVLPGNVRNKQELRGSEFSKTSDFS